MMITRTMGLGRIGGLGIVPAASAARGMRVSQVAHNELFGIFGGIRALAGCSAKTFSLDGNRIGTMVKGIESQMTSLAQKLSLPDFDTALIRAYVRPRARDFFEQAQASSFVAGPHGAYLLVSQDFLAISNMVADLKRDLDLARNTPNMDPADAISLNANARRNLFNIWQRAVLLEELFNPDDQACERIEIEV